MKKLESINDPVEFAKIKESEKKIYAKVEESKLKSK
jgi:hypothetical protein